MPAPRFKTELALAAIVAFASACRSDSASSSGAPAATAEQLAKGYGLEIRPAVPDGVPIRVLDAATGKPVAGALVVSVDESEFTYWDAGDGGIKWNARSLLLDCGQAYVTAPDGVVRVAAPDDPRSVFVWHGRDFGRTTLEEHDPSEHVVTVAPRALMVAVVDKSGKPQAGVPIQVGKCALEPMSLGTTVGITGPDGRFAIPALELERGIHRSCGRRALIMLGVPIGAFELRAIDAPELNPVKFVLPDCGTVDFDLQTTHPWPPTGEHASWPRFRLLVESSKRGERRGLERQKETDSERSISIPLDHPPYRLERVEVGTTLEFRLEIDLDESSMTYEQLNVIGADGVARSHVDGPSRAGERVHLLVRSESLGEPPESSPKEEPNAEAQQVLDKAREEDRARQEQFEKEASVASSIDVSLLLDVPIEACWLCARLDDNHEPNESNSCPWIDVNGRATMRAVPPGMHSVTITERRMSNEYCDVPLVRIDDVDVEPRQHVRDPRLLNIDLRGRLRAHHLLVSDGDGHPLSGFVRFTRDGDPHYAGQMWFEDGRASFLTAVDDGVRASIAATRYRKLPLDLNSSEGTDAPRRVFMQHGIRIRLQLNRDLELPNPSYDALYVGVSEMPHWFETLEDLRTVQLRKGADLTFEMAEAGDWSVIFLRSHDDGTDEPKVTECKSVETTISVKDDDGLVRGGTLYCNVNPDPDAWKGLMKSLGDSN